MSVVNVQTGSTFSAQRDVVWPAAQRSPVASLVNTHVSLCQHGCQVSGVSRDATNWKGELVATVGQIFNGQLIFGNPSAAPSTYCYGRKS